METNSFSGFFYPYDRITDIEFRSPGSEHDSRILRESGLWAFLDCVARWPGSARDSRVLHNSGLKQLFERGFVAGGYHLLGDSWYPSKTSLLTPI